MKILIKKLNQLGKISAEFGLKKAKTFPARLCGNGKKRCGIGIFPLRAFSDTTSEIISNRVVSIFFELLKNLKLSSIRSFQKLFSIPIPCSTAQCVLRITRGQN
jgi:hypothetical protein